MRAITYLLTSFVVAATLLPLLRREEWWVRVFDFPRPQILALGLLTAGFLVLRVSDEGSVYDWVALSAIGVAMMLQAYRLLPFTPLASRQVRAAQRWTEGSTISLLVANVQMRNREAERLLAIVRQAKPDLLLTLETDEWWQDRLRALVEFPHKVERPLENRYGIMLQSRLELVDPEVSFLVSRQVPSIHTKVRMRSGPLVSLHCLHPEPPSPTEAYESTRRDAELIIVGRSLSDTELPVIVAGDLNDVAWSHTTRLFRRISGLLDPRIGRGLVSTFHARLPFLRFPLDHVFHSPDFTLIDMRRLSHFGSDHFPVFVRLSLDRRGEQLQEAPEADSADWSEAREKVERANRPADRSR